MKSQPAILVLFCFFLFTLADAEQTNIDSLKTELERAPEDTVRVNTLNQLSYLIFSSSPDEAIRYGSEAKELAEKLGFKKGRAYALKNIGLGQYMEGNYLDVLDNWQQSLSTFEELDDQLGVANLVNNLGAVYYNQGNDAKAIEYYLRSLQVSEDIGDKLRIATAYVNIGSVYLNKQSTQKTALDYFLRALPLSIELEDQEAIGTTAANIGEIYYSADNYDSALLYFEQSLNAYEEIGSGNAAYSLNYIGKVYSKKTEYSLAIDYHKEAYDIAARINDKVNMAKSLLGLANTYNAREDFRSALTPFQQVESIAQEIGANKELQETYAGLALAYARLSHFHEAFEYQSKLTDINLTLYNAENDRKIERLQFSYEIDKQQDQIELLEKNSEIQILETERQKTISIAAGVTGLLFLMLAAGIFNRYKYAARTKKIIEAEKDRSENLLLNILPSETAEELKQNGEAKARSYELVSILFTDFKGFTAIAAQLSPEQLVEEIHQCYKAFDEIMTRRGVEKIKTIGDAYMAAGGLPVPNDTHATDVVNAAIEIRDYMLKLKEDRVKDNRPYFEIRIGVHSGPVVAGIVGIKKFAYDIWGDTVNIASRMESNSEPGMINISEATSKLIEEEFDLKFRGEIEAKNRGKLKMYFVEGKKHALSQIPLES